MNMHEAVVSCLQKYVTFSGRAPRSEYWYWVLCTMVIAFVLALIDVTLLAASGGALSNLFTLVAFLPGVAVTVRRLHDINRSGWWILIGMIPIAGLLMIIFWATIKGDKGDNSFGSDPLAGRSPPPAFNPPHQGTAPPPTPPQPPQSTQL